MNAIERYLKVSDIAVRGLACGLMIDTIEKSISLPTVEGVHGYRRHHISRSGKFVLLMGQLRRLMAEGWKFLIYQINDRDNEQNGVYETAL